MSDTLNHTCGHVIANMLADKHVVNLPTVPPAALGDWPCYVDLFPDQPDNAVIITNTEDVMQGREQFGGAMQLHYGFQVQTRSKFPAEARDKLNRILWLFDQDIQNTHVAFDGSVYEIHAVTRRSGIIPLGPEVGATTRRLFALNAIVSISLLSSEDGAGTGS